MKQTQELLERSYHVLEQTTDLIERVQPILDDLRTFLTLLGDLRTDLKQQSQLLQRHLSGLETEPDQATVSDTPLPDRNGTTTEHKPALVEDTNDAKDWEEEVPELPSISVSLAEFELPWERLGSNMLKPTMPTSRKAPASVSPPSPSRSPAGSERRATPRRTGNPTSVTIRIGEETLSGWVVDRSPLGVGMLVDDALEAGALILIKPNAAPSDCPSVEGEVRHCQPEKGQYRVGVRFTNTLSWQHLRYFG
jgi:hypothetical protein